MENKRPEPQMGIGAHTDYECFTILWQTEPGLQVQNRKNEWIDAIAGSARSVPEREAILPSRNQDDILDLDP